MTNLAGVPYTFELLERGDHSWLATPSLRLLTQAGGRLPAEQVQRWAQRARGWGAELFVMYGQTEATARIAYLPPSLVERHPAAIGRAIPGGMLRLRTAGGEVLDGPLLTDGAEGELLYQGPNVMLGYAHQRADLALGATVDELATGDLARYHAENAVFEIVGRAARFTKLFGLRLDLDTVEAMVRPLAPGAVAALGDDRRLRIAAPGADAAVLHRHVTTGLGLPAAAVEVRADADIVRTDAGKIDYAGTAARWPEEPPAAAAPAAPAVRVAADDRSEQAARIVAAVLGRRRVDVDRSFVALGGDSLSYVECSLRLESLLGPLPADWHHQPLRRLAARRGAAGEGDGWGGGSEARPRRTVSMDTTILLRATAICMVVSYHMGVFRSPGGAHLMLALAGYNFARFLADIASPAARLRAAVRTCSRVATPAVLWLGVGHLLFGLYELPMVLLVHNYVGSPDTFFDSTWAYWFFEVFVHLTLAAALLAGGAGGRPAAPPLLRPAAGAVRGGGGRPRLRRLPEARHFLVLPHPQRGLLLFLLGWLAPIRHAAPAPADHWPPQPGFFNSPRQGERHRGGRGATGVVAGGAGASGVGALGVHAGRRQPVDSTDPLRAVAPSGRAARTAGRSPTGPRSPPAWPPGAQRVVLAVWAGATTSAGRPTPDEAASRSPSGATWSPPADPGRPRVTSAAARRGRGPSDSEYGTGVPQWTDAGDQPAVRRCNESDGTATLPIDIGIEEADRKAVTDGLSRLLADTYTLYLKTHNFHWNVTGPMFQTLHLMFETQYNELALAVDLIAERIRSLGEPAPGSYCCSAAVLGDRRGRRAGGARHGAPPGDRPRDGGPHRPLGVPHRRGRAR
ncbi:MAG: AMP-binding protein [Acidimicrobiales bacterium]